LYFSFQLTGNRLIKVFPGKEVFSSLDFLSSVGYLRGAWQPDFEFRPLSFSRLQADGSTVQFGELAGVGKTNTSTDRFVPLIRRLPETFKDERLLVLGDAGSANTPPKRVSLSATDTLRISAG